MRFTIVSMTLARAALFVGNSQGQAAGDKMAIVQLTYFIGDKLLMLKTTSRSM
jgi:hypothetical protein